MAKDPATLFYIELLSYLDSIRKLRYQNFCKWTDKVYLSYTGYPGGQREMTPARLITKPNGEERLLKKVVKGMLPKNILGAKLLNNLYVYAGSEHKQAAQNPKMIDINSYK